jgi:FkbM family methyltransferase
MPSHLVNDPIRGPGRRGRAMTFDHLIHAAGSKPGRPFRKLNSDAASPINATAFRLLRMRWRRVRTMIGRLAGRFSGCFIRPIFGFGFDLGGSIYRVDEYEFEIPVHLTDRNYRSAFVFGEYESAERKLIRRFLRPEDRVIELGGCIGILSCLVNSRLKSPGNHLVVEANPELIPILSRHRAINGAGFRIEECAVSSEPEVNFAVHRLMTHSSVLAQPDARFIKVPGRSLVDLHYSHGPFNTLLIDVEGGELEVLNNSRHLLRDYRLVIIEQHRDLLGAEGVAACRRILTSAGLRSAGVIESVEAWIRPDLFLDHHNKALAGEPTLDPAAYLASYI